MERFALNEKGVVSIGIGRMPGHLTCLLRNLYVGQEATLRTGHGTVRGNTLTETAHPGQAP